ncbi:antibiotic biosynthesis monooxygenase [Aestuariibaculum sp. YM273]|uniref:antibiotic biosynthesis monooxygenase family protein n=1 Tax=Aestuariibaculum sp. YM273 TaxID=3070659 RepID=UPI0027DDEA83|nr:antibiotic biosynthesis monooxygenase [Aestuariibaculum sp. YM273]WMI65948.1 antibiotic biosynthesis monooxygenase [Aestuariibaculum sp. YM273]
MLIANTPEPPYYAVIFSSIKTNKDEGYEEMAEFMVNLAKQQEGFLGIESARDEIGITVSYWKDFESIRNWKNQVDHQVAQKRGKKEWYKAYKVRIAKVERDYGF